MMQQRSARYHVKYKMYILIYKIFKSKSDIRFIKLKLY